CQGLTCPASDVGALPATLEARTARDAPSLLGHATCGRGGDSAPEVAFGFTAPAAGPYRFSTRGSGFDTVLYLREATCSGRELACNDDGDPAGWSALEVVLEAGQRVVAVVDGFGREFGAVRLSV